MNNNRKYIAVLAIILGVMILLPNVGMADLIVLTFDELSNGTRVDNQYSALGVDFSADYFPGFTGAIYPVYYDTRGGIEFGGSYCNSSAFFIADFSVPVDSVAVEIEPFENFGGSAYDFGLAIYDSTGILIDEVNLSQLINTPGTIISLSLNSPSADIASATFFGFYGGEGGVNAITADNFTYNAPVPEPGTILLMGIGLVGLAGFGRKKFLK